MRRVTVLATIAGAGLAACNLLSGAGDLTADGVDPALGDASNERVDPAALDGGGASRADGSTTDGAATVDAAYACTGASCFDAGTCAMGGGPNGLACPVKIFAAGTGAIGAIAADAHGVYWTVPAARRIDRLLSTSSGPDVLVSVPDGTPTALAVGSNGVYWTESDSGRVRYVASTADAGAAPAATMSGQAGVSVLGVGSGNQAMIWTNDAGAITIAPTDLSQTLPAASDQAPVVGVGIYALEPYWASAGTINAIRGAGNNGVAADIVSAVVDLRAFIADSSHLYWTTGTGRVENSTHTGTGRVAILGEGEPVAIAADGTTMYWVNIADGRVRSAPIAGGAATTLASGQSRPKAIAVAGTVVYWVNDTGGEVWALHR